MCKYGMCSNTVTAGASQGSCDVLAYHVLINAKTLQVCIYVSEYTFIYVCFCACVTSRTCMWLQSYVGLLLETKCLVLMGTKGSCKSSVANYLGKHLVFRMGDQDEGRIVTFNVAIDGHEVCKRVLLIEIFNRLTPIESD